MAAFIFIPNSPLLFSFCISQKSKIEGDDLTTTARFLLSLVAKEGAPVEPKRFYREG